MQANVTPTAMPQSRRNVRMAYSFYQSIVIQPITTPSNKNSAQMPIQSQISISHRHSESLDRQHLAVVEK
jgi:hypothetical protein